MIVRDEEALLPVCLRAVRDWVDAITIVDTGSTDNTVEIAHAFGATVHHFDWCDDFSAARNDALTHSLTPWTLWLDCDDLLLNPEILPTITEAARKTRVNALWSTYVQDATCEQRRLQLFKTRDFTWQGVVHESPVPKNHALAKHQFTDLKILHRKPRDRALPAALKYLHILLDKDPTNYLGLAESYRFLCVHPDDPSKVGEYKTLAESYYWQASQVPGVNAGTQYMALFQCARLGMEMAQESKNIEWLQLAFKNAQAAYQLIPERAEALVLTGQIAEALGHKEDAKECYREALQLPKPDDIGVVYDAYYKEIPKMLLDTIDGT